MRCRANNHKRIETFLVLGSRSHAPTCCSASSLSSSLQFRVWQGQFARHVRLSGPDAVVQPEFDLREYLVAQSPSSSSDAHRTRFAPSQRIISGTSVALTYHYGNARAGTAGTFRHYVRRTKLRVRRTNAVKYVRQRKPRRRQTKRSNSGIHMFTCAHASNDSDLSIQIYGPAPPNCTQTKWAADPPRQSTLGAIVSRDMFVHAWPMFAAP
jgi:hypothetical protein